MTWAAEWRDGVQRVTACKVWAASLIRSQLPPMQHILSGTAIGLVAVVAVNYWTLGAFIARCASMIFAKSAMTSSWGSLTPGPMSMLTWQEECTPSLQLFRQKLPSHVLILGTKERR